MTKITQKSKKAQITLINTIPFLVMILGAVLTAFYPTNNGKIIGGLILAIGVALSLWIK